MLLVMLHATMVAVLAAATLGAAVAAAMNGTPLGSVAARAAQPAATSSGAATPSGTATATQLPAPAPQPAPGPATAATPPPSAEAVAKGTSLLTEARKALGGDERLRGVKTLQINGTFRRSAGNNTLEGDVEVFLELPQKYRRNESTGIAGGPIVERTEVLNGTEVWDQNAGGGFGGFGGFGGGRGFGGGGRGRFGDGGGQGDRGGDRGADRGGQAQGAPQIDPERLKDAQRRTRQAEVSRLLVTLLLSTDGTIAWIGTAESPEGSADVVEVTPAQGAASRLFLDTRTHMPLMITTTAGGGRGGRRGGDAGGRRGNGQGDGRGVGRADGAVDPGVGNGPRGDAEPAVADGQPRRGGARGGAQGPQQPITIETHLSEYKAVNGIKFPHLMTRGVNGQTNEEWVVKNYKVNQTFKGNTFTR